MVANEILTLVPVGAVALYTLVTAASRAIDRLVGLAKHYHVSELLVGMTVLAAGTSLPELGSHLVASIGIVSGTLDYRTTSAVVIGGNLGSSSVQQFLLIGVLLIGYGSVELSERFVRESYLPMLATFAVTLALLWDGTVGRLDGAILLALYGAYVAVSVATRERTRTIRAPSSVDPRRDGLVAAGLLVLVLLAATVVLSVVESVVALLDLGGSTVGVVTIGVAAALPELTAVVDAIRRQAPNVALGTLVGSNIVNPLVGLGLGGVVSTYYVPSAVVLWDLPFKLLVGAGVLGWAWYVNDGALTRAEGISLLGLYFAFVIGRLLLFPGQ